MSESMTAARWIYSTLAADATITAAVTNKIFDNEAPQGVTTPYIIFQQYVPSRSSLGLGAVRIKENVQYVVKLVQVTNSYSAMEAVADRIDELLHAKQTTIASGVILSCVRLNEIKYAEPDEGVVFRHLGGIYALEVQ